MYREIIQESIDYIEDNLKTELSAQELSDRAGFSPFLVFPGTHTDLSGKYFRKVRKILIAYHNGNIGNREVGGV